MAKCGGEITAGHVLTLLPSTAALAQAQERALH